MSGNEKKGGTSPHEKGGGKDGGVKQEEGSLSVTEEDPHLGFGKGRFDPDRIKVEPKGPDLDKYKKFNGGRENREGITLVSGYSIERGSCVWINGTIQFRWGGKERRKKVGKRQKKHSVFWLLRIYITFAKKS